jgi:hypothetical protein
MRAKTSQRYPHSLIGVIYGLERNDCRLDGPNGLAIVALPIGMVESDSGHPLRKIVVKATHLNLLLNPLGAQGDYLFPTVSTAKLNGVLLRVGWNASLDAILLR